MKVSYAQNYEDILIHRLFAQKPIGFYVDVGAAHPTKDSVTRFFYDRGWSGINIEPNKKYFEDLKKARPRDTNLWAALSDQRGEVDYFYVEEDPKISFIGDVQDGHQPAYKNLTLRQSKVQMETLTHICEAQCVGNIDFLKVDVEGAEELVLKGMNFDKFRPRLIVIEAVGIKSVELTQKSWLPLLTRVGYVEAYFDGINSYFLEETDQSGRQFLSVPLNSSDNFIKYQHTRSSFFLKHKMKGWS